MSSGLVDKYKDSIGDRLNLNGGQRLYLGMRLAEFLGEVTDEGTKDLTKQLAESVMREFAKRGIIGYEELKEILDEIHR